MATTIYWKGPYGNSTGCRSAGELMPICHMTNILCRMIRQSGQAHPCMANNRARSVIVLSAPQLNVLHEPVGQFSLIRTLGQQGEFLGRSENVLLS